MILPDEEAPAVARRAAAGAHSAHCRPLRPRLAAPLLTSGRRTVANLLRPGAFVLARQRPQDAVVPVGDAADGLPGRTSEGRRTTAT
jgi:hypothetical protein